MLVPAPRQLTLERQLNKSIVIGWTAPEAAAGTVDCYHVYVDGLLRTTVRASERTRALIEGGACVALASDYNPGSSPSGRMPFVVSLGCIACRLTPAEAINAATVNGAAALEWSDTYGSITPGRPAAYFLTRPLPSLAYLPYAFGTDLVTQTWIAGAPLSPPLSD